MLSGSFAMVVVAASAAGAAWVGYFRWKDGARPEPLWMLAAVAGGGAVSIALAFAGYAQLERWGIEILWSTLEARWPEAIGAALLIGLVEESAKVLPVVAVAVWSRHFDEWLDGAIYAGCSGIGFAVAETVLQAWSGAGLVELWPRILAAPLTHALFAAPLGLAVSAWVFARNPGWVLAGMAAAVTAHAAYDLALARSGGPSLVSGGVVLVLWVGLILLVPRLARRGRVVASRS